MMGNNEALAKEEASKWDDKEKAKRIAALFESGLHLGEIRDAVFPDWGKGVNYQPLKELALPLEGIASGFGAGSLPTGPCIYLSKPRCFDFMYLKMHDAWRLFFCLYSCKWPIHLWLKSQRVLGLYH